MPTVHARVEVPFPVEEVWAWHRRPGAIHRLLAPWLALRVIQEADALRDGAAVLGLPGGLRWTATHDPDAYVPNERFVDALSTPGLRQLVGWTHQHEFVDVGDGRTQVIDRVRARVPAATLRRSLEYRGRQLAGDLDAHARHAAFGAGSLTVAITGASGLVGSALVPYLTTGGHRVIRLVRRAPAHPDERRWDPARPDPDLFDGVDAVVHLAGEPIGQRFTAAHRAAVRDSRVDPTRRLAEIVGDRAFVVASAVGFYGPNRGGEILTETSERGDGFIAEVVAGWEAATEPARHTGARVVNVRTGIVQSPKGGVLARLRPLFAAGLGGRLGSGTQWTAWIGLDDLLDVYGRALVDPALAGPVNAVAPEPVDNAAFTRTLGRVMRRPTVMTVPAIGPRVLFGAQGAREFVLAGQRAVPERLERSGHRFRHPHLEPALRHLLGRTPPTET